MLFFCQVPGNYFFRLCDEGGLPHNQLMQKIRCSATNGAGTPVHFLNSCKGSIYMRMGKSLRGLQAQALSDIALQKKQPESGSSIIQFPNQTNSGCLVIRLLLISQRLKRIIIIMKRKYLLYILIFIYAFAVKVQSQNIYFPPISGNTWETVSPDSLGWCTENIDTLYNFLEQKHTKAFLVLKDGKIVIEHYFGSFTQDSIWYWASAGKTLTAFLVGIAQEEGYFSIQDSTAQYLGAGWTSCPPEKEQLITIRNQLTMTSGLDDGVSDPYCTDPSCLVYLADAGTRWAYHNAPYTLLDKVVENSTGQNYNVYFNSKIRSRIGMNGLWLQSGYNNIYYSNARSMARYGILIQNHGVWDTDTLLHDSSYFNAMVNTSQDLNKSYGYLWWLAGKESYMIPQSQIVFAGTWAPDAPSDMIAALGKNGQILNVVPSLGLVLVRMGDPPDTSLYISTYFNNQIWQLLNNIICSQTAVKDEIVKPSGFYLQQNYPNPFNPLTVISFGLPKESYVKLIIYNSLGEKVDELVNKRLSAGYHQYNWDGNKLSSGLYFYTLAANTNEGDHFYNVKKMLLIK